MCIKVKFTFSCDDESVNKTNLELCQLKQLLKDYKMKEQWVGDDIYEINQNTELYQKVTNFVKNNLDETIEFIIFSFKVTMNKEEWNDAVAFKICFPKHYCQEYDDIDNEYNECSICYSKEKTDELFFAQPKGYIKKHQDDLGIAILDGTVELVMLPRLVEKLKEAGVDQKYLRKYIYQIDSTTMATENELNGKVLLNTNLKLRKSDEPQILIYHTHGSEAYRGSRKGRKSDTVIGVGDVLTKRLEQKNIKVVHDRNIYDVKNGKEERSKAYNYAATAIEKNLKKYPSIQVVIDLHRDGVNESTKLVTRQNGKRMAQIMFFNGMSRTATNGNIKYLKNPNKQTNLAFSLQLQAQAALKYPGFTRKIYVKGYRYNLHYRGRSLLVEVGAQNNTLSEAKASMSLLAELLNNVLY